VTVLRFNRQGTAVNMLQMHPSGRRLLVHTRNNRLQLIDLRVLVSFSHTIVILVLPL